MEKYVFKMEIDKKFYWILTKQICQKHILEFSIPEQKELLDLLVRINSTHMNILFIDKATGKKLGVSYRKDNKNVN